MDLPLSATGPRNCTAWPISTSSACVLRWEFHDGAPASPAPERAARHLGAAALARHFRPDRGAAGGDRRPRLPAAVLALHGGHRHLRVVQHLAAAALSRE